MTPEQDPKWDVKVTSKGQITLPKQARDAMMVKEGDHLEATMGDGTIVLRRRDEASESEKAQAYARRRLQEKGIDPGKPHPEHSPSEVRKRMPTLPIDLTRRIREQREGREEQ